MGRDWTGGDWRGWDWRGLVLLPHKADGIGLERRGWDGIGMERLGSLHRTKWRAMERIGLERMGLAWLGSLTAQSGVDRIG